MKKMLFLILGIVMLLMSACGGKKSSAESYMEGGGYDMGYGYMDGAGYGASYSEYDKYFKQSVSTTQDTHSASQDFAGDEPYIQQTFNTRDQSFNVDKGNKGKKDKKQASYDDYDPYQDYSVYGDDEYDPQLDAEAEERNRKFQEMIRKTEEYGQYNRNFEVRDNAEIRMKKIRARDAKMLK